MSTLQERLAIAMAGDPPDYPPVSAAALARACGVSRPSVSEWVNGPTKTLRGDNLINAAICLGVAAQWLADGTGPMRPKDRSSSLQAIVDGKAGTSVARVAPHKTREGYIRFPLLEGFAGMGRGDYVGDYPEIVDFVEVTREWASLKLRGVPLEAVRVITGRGDSMRGQFDDGDLVFVDASVKAFNADSAYVFRWGGRVQIKRLQFIGSNRVRIISKNPEYPAIDVAIEELEIGGRALAAWTLREF